MKKGILLKEEVGYKPQVKAGAKKPVVNNGGNKDGIQKKK